MGGGKPRVNQLVTTYHSWFPVTKEGSGETAPGTVDCTPLNALNV